MQYRNLGKTDLKVSHLAFGGLFVASFGAQFDQAKAAVHKAIDLGVNYIDTAPGYGDSEHVLGRALEGMDKPVILSTKLGGRPQPFDAKNPSHLTQSVEESLRLLKRDYIDILMIHEPDRPGQYDWWTDWDKVEGPVLGVLDDLKRRGLIRYTGLGGTTAYEIVHIIKSGKFDVLLTAFNYSLLWREAAIDVIPAAKALGMGIVIGSPLQQGSLARRFDEDVNNAKWLSRPRREQYQALYKLLDQTGMNIAEMGIRFVISNPDVSCVLMGSRSPEEVMSNFGSVQKGPLPGDVLSKLDQIAAMVPFRPFQEPFSMPFGRAYRGPGQA